MKSKTIAKTSRESKRKHKTELELEYNRRFIMPPAAQTESSTLEQPHVLKIVRSVVTYSAYEDPI